MSRSKFASVTAELLTRKGQAKPWLLPDAGLRVAPPSIVEPDEGDDVSGKAPVRAPRETGPDQHIRRCSLRLSRCEYQRLGIIAVKRNTTRQKILRAAIEEYLAGIELEYGESCGCLAGHECTSSHWPDGTPQTPPSLAGNP